MIPRGSSKFHRYAYTNLRYVGIFSKILILKSDFARGDDSKKIIQLESVRIFCYTQIAV